MGDEYMNEHFQGLTRDWSMECLISSAQGKLEKYQCLGFYFLTLVVRTTQLGGG